VDKLILEKALGDINKYFYNKKKNNLQRPTKSESFDTKDFNLAFVRGLSLADGAATLTEYTAQNIILKLLTYDVDNHDVILCGGGRKNKFLTDILKKKISIKFIDEYGIDGDFIESQAFGYLAIRSFLKLEISFPETTGVIKPCLGGVIIKS
jgi:anhydro-N-acetylmuramic acid kinase